MMKYPKLKCEDKLNIVVCAMTLKKMKSMHKTGLSYSDIALSLKIPYHIILYHISPSQTSTEAREIKRKYLRKYQKRRYNTDPEFRRKMLDSISKSHARRRKDSNYKKWEQQTTKRNFKNWKEKQRKIHPNWSSVCLIGSHVTTNHKSKCLNAYKKCKCPCHKT